MRPETKERLILAAAIVAAILWLCAWPLAGAWQVERIATQLHKVQP